MGLVSVISLWSWCVFLWEIILIGFLALEVALGVVEKVE